MKVENISLFLIIFFISFSGIAQDKFRIINTNKKSATIPFTLVNNLIVISADVNGKELSFLVDTGIVKTILFNLKFADSLQLNHIEKIQLRGLGDGEPINALKSKGNLVQIRGVANYNHTVYLITDGMFDLSTKMGMNIHGIIGGDLLKDFVIKVNYSTKKLTFYKPDTYVYKTCKKCETFPLEFYNQKPFIDVHVENHFGEEFKAKLLIDSGGGDALWLFESTHPKIIIPNKYFRDYLGKGLNGDIYGKRSRVKKLRLGSFILNNTSVSYPDSTSIVTAIQNNKNRNGTLGAEILKRFHVIFDYPHSKITLHKNTKLYKAPFLYNKSGIEIIYGSEMLVKEARSKSSMWKSKNSVFTEILYTYNLAYKPSFEISNIREESPAKFAGLLVGDIILEINGDLAHEKEMQEIISILSGRENKKIKILVARKGKHLKYEFYLKDML